MPPFVVALLSQGLSMLANTALTKGSDYIKEKTGVDISSSVLGSADLLKLKQFELEHEDELMKDRLEEDKLTLQLQLADITADTSALETVNKTMQAEAANSANENWWQKGWRPFNGYVVGLGSFVSVCFVCWLFYETLTSKPQDLAAVIAMIPQLAFNISCILAVPGAAVGITAWHRGRLQREQIGEAK